MGMVGEKIPEFMELYHEKNKNLLKIERESSSRYYQKSVDFF